MNPAEKSTLYRELAKMTQADFHLDRSLVLLLSQKISSARRFYLEGMQRGLAEGKSLADSIRVHNQKLVTGLELALIESGERSGKLSAAFHHLTRYYAAAAATARQIRGAMIYPLILLHLAIILPEIPAIFTATEGPGFLTRIATWFGALWAGLIGVYFLWRLLSRVASTSVLVDICLNHVPLIGRARRHWALARFCQVFHAGLLASLRISEVCRLSGEASQSGNLRAGAFKAAERIEAKGDLGLSLAESGAFETMFVNAISTAEEVGNLDGEMARWSTAETLSATEAMERASLWVPKIGYGLIVVFVVYRIISMMQGYFGGMLQHLDGL